MQETASTALATQSWIGPALVWIGVLIALLVGCCAWQIWLQRQRLCELSERLALLDKLEGVERAVSALAAARGDLDLRRLEHVLVDLRDGQRRFEDALLRAIEHPRASGGAQAPGLSDAIVNRLLSLGYERVQLAAPAEQLARLETGDGDVLVEARRSGVAHKGRVLVRAGRIHAVEIQPPFAAFP
jgi:hypothetical protein